MKENKEPILVMLAAPDQKTGKKLARALVEDRLAACVNISQSFLSVYRWEGEIQEESEVILLIKTRSNLLEKQLIPRIQELHPYDLPEIIALPVLAGEKNYLDWVMKETDRD